MIYTDQVVKIWTRIVIGLCVLALCMGIPIAAGNAVTTHSHTQQIAQCVKIHNTDNALKCVNRVILGGTTEAVFGQ